jgi:hypothetical protein
MLVIEDLALPFLIRSRAWHLLYQIESPMRIMLELGR